MTGAKNGYSTSDPASAAQQKKSISNEFQDEGRSSSRQTFLYQQIDALDGQGMMLTPSSIYDLSCSWSRKIKNRARFTTHVYSILGQ